MRKFMWCCATHGSARRYLGNPSHHKPLIPRRAKPASESAAKAELAAPPAIRSIMIVMTPARPHAVAFVILLSFMVILPRAQDGTAPAATAATAPPSTPPLFGPPPAVH